MGSVRNGASPSILILFVIHPASAFRMFHVQSWPGCVPEIDKLRTRFGYEESELRPGASLFLIYASNRLSIVHRPSVDFGRHGSINFSVSVHFAAALLQYFDELSLLAGYDRAFSQGGGFRQNSIGSFSA